MHSLAHSASKLRPRLFFSVAWVALALAACRDDGGERPFSGALTVWNRGQFEVLHLYVHTDSDYRDDVDLLATSGPLAVETSLSIADFKSGTKVTFVRKKIDVGDEIAVTTNSGVEIDRIGYTLVLFDESFRLLEPDNIDNPFANGD
mgnify:CR=1 FL=1